MSRQTDINKKHQEIFNLSWELLEDFVFKKCLECGKEIDKSDVIFVIDKTGMLFFCTECAWHQVKIKETWRKILKS